jgi:hypothetical protein
VDKAVALAGDRVQALATDDLEQAALVLDDPQAP